MFVNHHNFRVLGNELKVRQASYRAPSEVRTICAKYQGSYNNTVRMGIVVLFVNMESRVSSFGLQIAVEKHSGCPNERKADSITRVIRTIAVI